MVCNPDGTTYSWMEERFGRASSARTIPILGFCETTRFLDFSCRLLEFLSEIVQIYFSQRFLNFRVADNSVSREMEPLKGTAGKVSRR